MSRIKDVLMDIEELYHRGMKPQDIAESLKISITLVNDGIRNLCGANEDYEYYMEEGNESND